MIDHLILYILFSINIIIINLHMWYPRLAPYLGRYSWIRPGKVASWCLGVRLPSRKIEVLVWRFYHSPLLAFCIIVVLLGFHEDRSHRIMSIASQFIRSFLSQSIVKESFWCFVLWCIILLPKPNNLIHFIGMNFGNILYNHSQIFGIELSCKFFIIVSIFKDNSLA